MNWALTAPEQIIAVSTAGSSGGLREDAIRTVAAGRPRVPSARRNPAQIHRITHMADGWASNSMRQSRIRHISSEVGMNVRSTLLLRAAVALLVLLSPAYGQARQQAAKGIPSLADFDDSIEALVRTVDPTVVQVFTSGLTPVAGEI